MRLQEQSVWIKNAPYHHKGLYTLSTFSNQWRFVSHRRVIDNCHIVTTHNECCGNSLAILSARSEIEETGVSKYKVTWQGTRSNNSTMNRDSVCLDHCVVNVYPIDDTTPNKYDWYLFAMVDCNGKETWLSYIRDKRIMVFIPPFKLGANIVDPSWNRNRQILRIVDIFIKQPPYSISQEICTRLLLCCALLCLCTDWFTHIHQAYFTGTVAI